MSESESPNDLPAVRRSSLIDSKGRTYLEIRRTLTPLYRVIWLQIAIGWIAVTLISTGLVIASDFAGNEVVWQFILVLLGTFSLGFVFHFLLLFQHEGAHYNLARNRRANDRLTNTFIGVFVGEDVRNYRKIHLDHHRYLGTPQDTEHSYFDSLDGRFFLLGLSGLRLLRVIAERRANLGRMDGNGRSSSTFHLEPMFIVALAFNGAIVIAAALTDHW